MKNLPIAILGSGPVGLAAAAHLAYKDIPFILFEKGGDIAESVQLWQHVKLFSPWKYNIDNVAKKLLSNTDWLEPDENELPTGKSLLDNYLTPLYKLPQIKPNVKLSAEVIHVGRQGIDKMKDAQRDKTPFEIIVKVNKSNKKYEARAVIDATGTWGNPNPLFSGAYPLEKSSYTNHIFYGIPDITDQNLKKYINKKVAVIGSGHSAINAILDLEKIQKDHPKTKIVWILRKKRIEDVYGGKENDALEARGALGIKIEELVKSNKLEIFTPFYLDDLYMKKDTINLIGLHGEKKYEITGINEIIVNNGSRPNFDFLREVRIDLDASLESVFDLAPLIDPNIHSCGSVRPHGERELRHPEKDFYIVGSKSYGRAPTFLMATGYEQVRSVVAYLDGDFEAAKRVELDLPETGVCGGIGDEASGCCTVKEGTKELEACC